MIPIIFIIIAILLSGGLVSGIVTVLKDNGLPTPTPPTPTPQTPTPQCVSDAGFYCSGDKIAECPEGTYCPNLNMISPLDCPSGYYCPTVTESIICPMGKYCPNICPK